MTSATITDIKILVGANAATPLGYVKDPTNLNLGTSNGTVLYLAYKQEENQTDRQQWVTGLDVIGGNDPTPTGWQKDPTDLNLGTGKNPLYLVCEKGGSGPAIRDIKIVDARYTPVDKMQQGYTLVYRDLNQGASGDWLWLTYLQDPLKYEPVFYYDNTLAVPADVKALTPYYYGQLYAITNNNRVLEYDNVFKLPGEGTWNPLAKAENTSVIVSDRSDLYRISQDGKIYKYDPQSKEWTPIGDNGNMIIANLKNVYCIRQDNSIYKYDGTPNNWTKIGEQGKMIAVNGDDTLYAIRQDGSIHQYDGTPNSWTQIGASGKQILALDNTERPVFVVTENNAIWKYDGTPMQWTQIGAGTKMVTGHGSSTVQVSANGTKTVIERTALFAIMGDGGSVFSYSDSRRAWTKTKIKSAKMIEIMPGAMLCAILTSDARTIHYYVTGREWFSNLP